jgi:excisionase family DNA binding protein
MFVLRCIKKERCLMPEQWVTMSEAAQTLGINVATISRMAKRGEIRSERDAVNKRVRLVELNEIKNIFAQSKYYQGR